MPRADLVARSSSAFAAIGGWSYDHRWVVLAVAIFLVAGSLLLASGAQVDSSYENYFDPADPIYTSYEQFREDFGSDEVSYILYEAPDFEHGPWNVDVMRRIAHLTEALEDEVPFIYEVRSLANAELMVGVGDGIEIHELRDDLPESQEELLALRDRYLAKPIFVGSILSADARFAAIVIEMDRSSTDPPDEIRLDPEGGDGLENMYPQPTESAISEILARPEYQGIAFYHSGDVPMNAAYNRIIGQETQVLQGITSLVIAVLLFVFFRSVVGVVGPILVVQLGVLMVVAFVALVGWKLDLSFSSAPTLLIAIGIAHSVHILSEFRGRFADLGDRREALVSTLYLVGTPCLLASLTTSAGFLAMGFAPIKSIAHMGVYNAFGVMAAFVLSFTLLMAFLSFGARVPPRRASQLEVLHAKGGALMQGALRGIAAFVVRRRAPVLGFSCVIFALSIAGAARLSVDSNWLDDFADDMPLKQTTLKVDEVMGGVTNLILLFDGGSPDSIQEPAVLRDIERMQEWAEANFELVRESHSIVDILKDLNQTFHAEDPAWYLLPDSRELVAQYLLLYETAGGSEADEFLSSDRQRASLELRLKLAPTSHTAELVHAIDEELDREPLETASMSLTGIGALWVKLMDYIVWSQIRGFLFAFTVIGAMMCVLFRSIKTGLVSMVPNLAPVLLTLGVMGWFGLDLDYTTVSVAAVAMGIAVDDTIHLVSRYRHEFERSGSYEEALLAAVLDVGRALVITSVALVCGFLVLLFSSLASQAAYGILLATTIVTALVADFLLMPALVLTFHPFGPEGARDRALDPLREAA
jgi:predicted RND superfamily exporter protein